MSEWASVVGSLAGVITGFGGSYYLASRQERKVSRRDLGLAVSEVVASAGDVVMGAHAVRSAYYPSSEWHDRIRLGARILAAMGIDYAGVDDLNWRSLGDTRYTIPVIDRLLAIRREQLQQQRQVVLDLAALSSGQSVRFFAAVAAPPIRTEERLVDVKDKLIDAVSSLVKSITAKDTEYERLREDLTEATLAFRRAGEALDRSPRRRWPRSGPTLR